MKDQEGYANEIRCIAVIVVIENRAPEHRLDASVGKPLTDFDFSRPGCENSTIRKTTTVTNDGKRSSAPQHLLYCQTTQPEASRRAAMMKFSSSTFGSSSMSMKTEECSSEMRFLCTWKRYKPVARTTFPSGNHGKIRRKS